MRKQRKPKPLAALVERFLVVPLFVAVFVALLMTSITVFMAWTGVRGKLETSGTPVPFLEAWHDVPMLAGLMFVVGFLVSVVWMILKGPSRVKPKSLQMASPTGLATAVPPIGGLLPVAA